MKIICSLVIMITSISLLGIVGNQRKATSIHNMSICEDEIKISLSVKEDKGKESSYLTEVLIENTLNDDIQLHTTSFRLEKKSNSEEAKQENFWASVAIKDFSKSKLESSYTLPAKTSVALELDLSKLKWQKSELSIYPNRDLKELVSEGVYDLYFKIQLREEIEKDKFNYVNYTSEAIQLTFK